MFDQGVIITAIEFLLFLIKIYRWGLIIYAFMSWIPGLQQSSIGDAFAFIYEPFLAPFRKIIPPVGGIDFSILGAFFTLMIIQFILIEILRNVIM